MHAYRQSFDQTVSFISIQLFCTHGKYVHVTQYRQLWRDICWKIVAIYLKQKWTSLVNSFDPVDAISGTKIYT